MVCVHGRERHCSAVVKVTDFRAAAGGPSREGRGRCFPVPYSIVFFFLLGLRHGVRVGQPVPRREVGWEKLIVRRVGLSLSHIRRPQAGARRYSPRSALSASRTRGWLGTVLHNVSFSLDLDLFLGVVRRQWLGTLVSCGNSTRHGQPRQQPKGRIVMRTRRTDSSLSSASLPDSTPLPDRGRIVMRTWRADCSFSAACLHGSTPPPDRA